MLIVKRVMDRFFKERFFDQAAQTAYYLLVSMLPFLIFILSLLSLFIANEEMLLDFLQPFTPVEVFALIERNVWMILNKNQGNMIYISLIMVFWLSSVAVQSLARSLDLANGYKRRYAFWKVLLRDLAITLLFMCVIPLSLLLPLIEQMIQQGIDQTNSVQLWEGWLQIRFAVRWTMGSLFLFAFLLLFYKVIPSGKVSVKEAFPGALLSTVGWQVFALGFVKYASKVDYTMLYGQLSGIILLVLWFYSTAVILLLSGLFNAEFRKISVHKRRG